jgi:hypothetical protein
MTVRSWNGSATGSASAPLGARANEAAPIVIILKKTQGSVWSEAGRTPLCPTIAWLRDTYGVGQYELRLKLGNRVVCMTLAECKAVAAPAALPASPGVAAPAQYSAATAGSTARLTRPLARTALGAW